MPKTGTVSSCRHIIVMGVAGSGKTMVGRALAERLGFQFIEGDDYHPTSNIERMAAGIPLSDADRWPWLRALADLVADRHGNGVGTVLACSALRRGYRDALREAAPAEESFVIQLDVDEPTLRSRLEHRRGHYMPASLLDSQPATLEPLQSDEAGTRVDAGRSLHAVEAEVLVAIRFDHR